LATATKTFPQSAAEYMSPYQENVVNQIADVGLRQLQEKFLPAVGEEFIKAGQFGPGRGSSRMSEFGARALRDVQEATLAEQAKALQAGYGQAADIFGADVSRAGQLAGTAGQLGTAQQRALLDIGQQYGQLSTSDLQRMLESGSKVSDIGSRIGQLTGEDAARIVEMGKATGQLTAEDASRIMQIGKTRGELTAADADRLVNIAKTAGSLTSDDASRLAEIGKTTGMLTGQDAELLAKIGQTKGQLGQEDARNLQNLAAKYAETGSLAQQLGLTGAGALGNIGATQRGLTQQNLDLAYQDFLRQQGYPQQQALFLSQLLQGIRLPDVTVQQRTDTAAQPGGASNLEKFLTGYQGAGNLADFIKKYLGG